MIGFFLFALVITIILEFIVYIIGIRQRWSKVASYCILINLFTVPLANILADGIFTSSFFIVEILVVLVETALIFMLFRNKLWKAFIVSFIANLVSAILGIFIMMMSFM